MKKISSPKFQLAGANFSIEVNPDNSYHSAPGFIGVYLHNYGNEDQTISMTIKAVFGSVTDICFKLDMRMIPASKGWGSPKFLSHEKYREMAKVHGDVLKLELEVTLHTKTEGDGWTR